MGRSTTPKYIVVTETNDDGHKLTPFAWQTRAKHNRPGDGIANDANLAKWVAGYNKSFEPGGANEHLSDAVGFVVVIHHATIYENCAGGAKIAEYRSPLFEVVAESGR